MSKEYLRLYFGIITDTKLRLESGQTGYKATENEQRENWKGLKSRWETEKKLIWNILDITAKMTIFEGHEVKTIEGRDQDDSKDFGLERQCCQ